MNDASKLPTYENKRWLSCENVTSAFDVWQEWEVNSSTHRELNEAEINPAIHRRKHGDQ